MPENHPARRRFDFTALFSRFFHRESGELLIFKPEHGTVQCLSIRQLPRLPLGRCELHVPAGQQVCLLQNGWRSELLGEGEHLLRAQDYSQLNPNAPLSILFVCPRHPINRTWQIAAGFALRGHYALKLHHTDTFLSHLIGLSNPLSLNDLDRWLGGRIRHIIEDNGIPTQDIHDHPKRLAQFLREVLNTRELHDSGAVLVDLQIRLDDEPVAEKAFAAAPATPAATAASTPPQERRAIYDFELEDPAVQAQAEIREYYRVIHGEQIGPFSRRHIQQLIDNHDVEKKTLLWKQGLPAWRHAASFPEFQWTEKPSV